jgi:hypothetical protein
LLQEARAPRIEINAAPAATTLSSSNWVRPGAVNRFGRCHHEPVAVSADLAEGLCDALSGSFDTNYARESQWRPGFVALTERQWAGIIRTAWTA